MTVTQWRLFLSRISMSYQVMMTNQQKISQLLLVCAIIQKVWYCFDTIVVTSVISIMGKFLDQCFVIKGKIYCV